MEPRSQGKRTLRSLGFRSSKKLLQLDDAKKRQMPSKLNENTQKTWPPAHGSESSKERVEERLPERLMLLEEMYHSMEAAISLLQIRRSMCTFSTIAVAVESSTQRRFSKSHLAQMKYILPEAFKIEDYTSWDAESQCSCRDLRITLLSISSKGGGAVQRCKSPQMSTDMVLRCREFHNRLLEFHRKNKETDVDVPQAAMFDEERRGRTCTKFEDVQEKKKACHTEEQQKAVQLDSLEDPEKELKDMEGDKGSLPVAFDMSQLKKYPRSPSRRSYQHRISPAPPPALMLHLPPVFKAHFSARKQTDPAELGESKVSENASELVSGLGSIIKDINPQFSLKRCKRAVMPTGTPQKTVREASLLEEQHPDCHAGSSPLPAAAMAQTSSFTSPRAYHGQQITISEAKCRTPAQSDGAVSSNFTSPVFKTPASIPQQHTPQQAILTPSVVPTPSAGPENKKEQDGLPLKRRKQAVIKSLRFGTPTKHGADNMTVLDSSNAKESSLMALSDAHPFSVQTLPNDISVVAKKSAGNVSRVLPFNSPLASSKKASPLSGCNEDGTATNKRVKLSLEQALASEACSSQQDFPQTGNLCPPTVYSEKASDHQLHEAHIMEFSSVSGSDRLSMSDLEVLKCLPQELLNDVQAKERKQLDDVQSGLEQARRRRQLIVGLPKLFNMVRLLFQSGNRTVLTRKDLVKMVFSSHPDITDQGEIMEQLQLLVEFASDWISLHRSSAGDLLYRINKNANMRAVSQALVNAK